MDLVINLIVACQGVVKIGTGVEVIGFEATGGVDSGLEVDGAHTLVTFIVQKTLAPNIRSVLTNISVSGVFHCFRAWSGFVIFGVIRE